MGRVLSLQICMKRLQNRIRVIQIVLHEWFCVRETALIQLEKDLYRRINKRERFVKTFCINGRHEMKYLIGKKIGIKFRR